MNNTFEWTRFVKVVRKNFSNMLHQSSNYLFLSASPALLWLFTWMLDSITQNPSNLVPEVRLAIIFAIACLTACLTPSILYKSINQPKEGIYFAMLPASKLEKYLSMLLFTIIICPLAVLCCSLVLDLVMTILPFGPYHQFIWQTTIFNEFNWYVIQQSEAVQMIPILGQLAVWVLVTIASLLCDYSIFVLGSTFFKKHKFLYTILFSWIISFVLQLIATPFLGTMMATNWEGLPNWATSNPSHSFAVVVWVSIAINLVLAGVLFWWAGHRLKRMTY